MKPPPNLREILKSKGLEDLGRELNLIPTHTQEWLSKFISITGYIDLLKRRVEYLSIKTEPVLIHGESGTGKEIIAQALHGDREGNFVPVNCAALDNDLCVAELFGHNKGTFTGADTDKPGLFEAAQHGTIFLDEISKCPLRIQAQLHRAVQERKVRRIGGHKEIPINFRVICATNEDLEQKVKDNLFYEDLYWRIAGYTLYIPPLRERRDDIREIIDATCDTHHILTEEFLATLDTLELRGNVRELQARVRHEKMLRLI